MGKKALSVFLIILLIGMPLDALSDSMKSIVIVVDEISMERFEKLTIDNYSIGFINLKSRNEDSEDNLYWSINLGKKVDKTDLDKSQLSQFLGDILKDEKLSHIGRGKEAIILSDYKNELTYEKKFILYDFDWLIKNTNKFLEKSNLLVLGYDLEDQLDRLDLLNEYLRYYKDRQIIILPKSVSKKDNFPLNKFLVPIIHINDGRTGLLTSLSTKRVGFVTQEDISVQLKNSYGYFNKTDIGNSFETIEYKNPLRQINKIYNNTMNLLIIAYIFHGLTYIVQVVSGLWLLKFNKINKNIYLLYVFSAIVLSTSIVLGFIGFNEYNIILYSFAIILISFLLSKSITNRKKYHVENLIIFTYGIIVLATLFYPEMIYNSYIGFNNLVYGARYYGLNNGIMGVLLSSSFISYLILNKRYNKNNLNKLMWASIFGLNMIVLSAGFAANTGGFITSIILFILMMNSIMFSKDPSLKKTIVSLLIALSIFAFNIYLDNESFNKSHAIEFFYRLKENGFSEFRDMALFKARELFLLTIRFPFSIVLIFQGLTLKRLSKILLKDNQIKKEVIIIIITSLIGFFINDTGAIMLIYMMNYYILYAMISCIKLE